MMPTKQILFSAFLFGTIGNIGLAMESNPNARRFDHGLATHLNDCNYCDFFMSLFNSYCICDDKIKLIEITYNDEKILQGTFKELKTSGFKPSKFNGIWDPISRNNAFFDPIEQAIFYGNALEKDPVIKAGFQFIESVIKPLDEKLLALNEELIKHSEKKEDQCKALKARIDRIKRVLSILDNNRDLLSTITSKKPHK